MNVSSTNGLITELSIAQVFPITVARVIDMQGNVLGQLWWLLFRLITSP